MLGVVPMHVTLLNAIAQGTFLSVIPPSVILLKGVLLSVFPTCVILQSVPRVSVVVLNVAAPL